MRLPAHSALVAMYLPPLTLLSSFFFTLLYSPSVTAHSDEDSTVPEEKPVPPRCSTCKHFLKLSDPHSLCVLCRPCTEEQPCELDTDWPPETWKEIASKRAEKELKEKAKKAAQPPDWSAFLATMESVASRLTALESRMQVRWVFTPFAL